MHSEAIRQSLHYVLRSGRLADEFHARMGVTEADVERVLASWPEVTDRADDSAASVAINNALNEVCHGLRIDEHEWSTWFTVNREDVDEAYRQWALGRGWKSTGIR